MPKYELNKLIEAKKLNPRNMLPVAEPPVTIPFGAVIDEVRFVGSDAQFKYLTDFYQCADDLLRRAMIPVGGSAEEPASRATPSVEESQPAAEPVATGPGMKWEILNSGAVPLLRSRIPGGWLIAAGKPAPSSVAFYPDPEHRWDGSSLD